MLLASSCVPVNKRVRTTSTPTATMCQLIIAAMTSPGSWLRPVQSVHVYGLLRTVYEVVVVATGELSEQPSPPPPFGRLVHAMAMHRLSGVYYRRLHKPVLFSHAK